MGLDMYLYSKKFLWTEDYVKEEHRDKLTLTTGGKEQDTSKVRYIVEEVGYWRKANQIHKWFVDNVQNGEDDCREYEVEEDKLLELYEKCKSVLEDGSKAKELLPVSSGFFFGSDAYDDWYFSDIKETVKIIESLFETDSEGNIVVGEFEDGTISYRASW